MIGVIIEAVVEPIAVIIEVTITAVVEALAAIVDF